MAAPIPPRVTMTLLDDPYVVCRLAPDAPIPSWCAGPGLVSITRTMDELSIVCVAARVPPSASADVRAEPGWRCFRFHGPFDFATTGVLASTLTPLADAGVGVFALSTFDTDYLLVKAVDLGHAVAALRARGHVVHTP